MSLSINNISNINSNFFSQSSSIVSGSELEKVSQEILSAAPNTQASQSTQSSNSNLPNINLDRLTNNTNNNNSLKVYGNNAVGTEIVQQMATNQASYNVTLSDKAISAIEALKTQAAKLSTENLTKNLDGKVFIPAASNKETKTEKPSIVTRSTEVTEAKAIKSANQSSNPFAA